MKREDRSTNENNFVVAITKSTFIISKKKYKIVYKTKNCLIQSPSITFLYHEFSQYQEVNTISIAISLRFDMLEGWSL